MSFAGLAYGLLQLPFWSITAALPAGAAGTRPAVGFPDPIPDVTFIARALTAADGNFTASELSHWNGYTSDARSFHATYGLTPVTINSLEHLLGHPRLPAGQIGRIRLISHGSADPEGMLFLPVFNGGLWDFGMPRKLIDALNVGDDTALRLLLSTDAANATQSPLLIDVVAELTNGIRAITTLTVLQPFGLQAPATSPSPELRGYFEVVNDLYQVQFGTIVVGTALPTPAQRATLTDSLTIIESAVRGRLDGRTVAGVTLRSADLVAFRGAVLARTPGELGFLGPTPILPNTAIADLQAALAASQADDDARIDAIRTAIAGVSREPVLNRDYLGNVITGLTQFNPAVLNLGGTPHDETAIRASSDLRAFALIAIDLHHLKNAPVLIGGVPPASPTPATPGQKASLRAGLMEIANLIRSRIAGPILPGQLAGLRDAIENLAWQRSTLTGGLTTVDLRTLRQLSSANASLRANFRTRLNAFRARMKPADASNVDIRGCLAGADALFLTGFRNLLGTPDVPGTNGNKPVVTAPDFWQSFPPGFHAPGGVTLADINTLVGSGLPSHDISPTNVTDAFDAWEAMINFRAHFDFIVALFAVGASKIDFASLAWREWRSPAAPAGIPVLSMEAPRLDDLTAPSMTLGDVIQRFKLIFGIPATSPPDDATRARLTRLQPQLATFKTISADVAAAAAPSPTRLQQFQTDLSGLATRITSIAGFATPSAPLVPANASPTLTDIQDALGRIRAHLDTILGTALDPFFAAVRGQTTHANVLIPRIRYYYNIGLPLLLKSSAVPTSFTISILMVGMTPDLVRKALRSWMRIQWKGTPTQATAMNTVIRAATDMGEMCRIAMLTDEDPVPMPGDPLPTQSGIHPMQAYHDHIITEPP